jgi:glutathione S-transferase
LSALAGGGAPTIQTNDAPGSSIQAGRKAIRPPLDPEFRMLCSVAYPNQQEPAMITLYGISASRAFRPLWMLEELGLAYEHVKTNFTGDNKQPDYLAINPNGRIPALVDGETVLFESMAINLYLAEKYDGGLWPKSTEDRGRALQWSFWVMTEVEKPLLEVLFHSVILPEDQREAAVAAAATEQLAAPLRVLDAALAGRDQLVGDAFGVADLNVASVLAWAQMARFDFSATPNVSRWLSACTSRPAAQAAQKK